VHGQGSHESEKAGCLQVRRLPWDKKVGRVQENFKDWQTAKVASSPSNPFEMPSVTDRSRKTLGKMFHAHMPHVHTWRVSPHIYDVLYFNRCMMEHGVGAAQDRKGMPVLACVDWLDSACMSIS
jgi:hypothetical protein